ncbi:DUF6415 family natural product biosynthesis protein [Streptomyces sp. CB02115]|uniref:DUF6415 family natural product biosynthesis protein n=1 Tax=Streptomyces sp. CB02115 TaxID=1703939 RepID=UPI00093BE17B|nr:DUF6415 family natural product biosynthesis protein [Streptomyces sp. CB02115]OKJ55933.1 hypothetical protein AMK28_13755 [Streptomyces sp. CB02115]
MNGPGGVRTESARKLTKKVLAWSTSEEKAPTLEEADTALALLTTYGKEFRDTVTTAYHQLPAGSAVAERVQATLGEASRRLDHPLPERTRKAVVGRAQNIARLLEALLRAAATTEHEDVDRP